MRLEPCSTCSINLIVTWEERDPPWNGLRTPRLRARRGARASSGHRRHESGKKESSVRAFLRERRIERAPSCLSVVRQDEQERCPPEKPVRSVPYLMIIAVALADAPSSYLPRHSLAPWSASHAVILFLIPAATGSLPLPKAAPPQW